MQKSVSAPTWLGINLVKNRWIFPVLGALTTLLGGAAYAFSVFIRPLEAEFGWARHETVAAFSVAMFTFGIIMWAGGFLLDKYGPKIVFFVGVVFLVLSQILSSRVDTIAELIFAFGIIGGIGLGLTYNAATIALVSRWYPEPEKRGLAIGVAVLGFGVGAVVAAPLWTAGIEAYGWRTTYMLTGLVFAVVLVIIGTILRFPPSDWHFVQGVGWQPRDGIGGDEKAAQKMAQQPAVDARDLPFVEAVKTPQLWFAGLLFFLSISGGLMAVSQIAAFARDPLPAGLAIVAAVAAQVVILIAIFNGSGRPFWGYVSNKVGLKTAYPLVLILMASAMAVLAVADSLPILALGAAMTGFAFGGTLALAPILTTAFFGPSFIGSIYGLVFLLGFGFGGLIGPMAGGYVRTTTGDYSPAFFAVAGVALVGAVLAALFIPKKGHEHLTRVVSRDVV